MKKAMMYLLLALGISLVVMFIGGAMVGFIVGFIDGFYGNEVGTTTSMSVMVYAGSASLLLLCIILNWVFLKLGFASYTLGRAPKMARWKVYAYMVFVFASIAIVNNVMPIQDLDYNYSIREFVGWMHAHPFYSILLVICIEATANLVIYGAVLREILDWKHRPAVVIPVYAGIMGIFSFFVSQPSFATIGFIIALAEGWIYEYSRSVVPVIIGDVAYWIVILSSIGTSWGWFAFLPLVVSIFLLACAMKELEPTKPID